MARDWKSIYPLGPGTLSTSRLISLICPIILARQKALLRLSHAPIPTSKRVWSFCLRSIESTFSKNKEEGSRIKGVSQEWRFYEGGFGTVFAPKGLHRSTSHTAEACR